jgi:hypothetical protein
VQAIALMLHGVTQCGLPHWVPLTLQQVPHLRRQTSVDSTHTHTHVSHPRLCCQLPAAYAVPLPPWLNIHTMDRDHSPWRSGLHVCAGSGLLLNTSGCVASAGATLQAEPHARRGTQASLPTNASGRLGAYPLKIPRGPPLAAASAPHKSPKQPWLGGVGWRAEWA